MEKFFLALIWIDDGFIGCKSKQLASQASKQVQSDLQMAGWVSNQKSNWELHQIGEWIGFIVNTAKMLIQIPERKIKKLESQIDIILLDPKNIHVKTLATSSQSEITDAPVFIFGFNVLFELYVHFELFVLLYFVIWSDSPYELPYEI